MKKLVNIVVLGAADIAQRFILPSLLELSEHYSILGIISKSGKKNKIFQDNFGLKIINEDYDYLKKIPNVDAVYIPLPNSLHSYWVEFCLLNGYHVLVEKSLATTFKDVKKLNDLARKNRLVLIENFQFRFHKQFDVITEALHSNEIGELRCLRSSFGFPPFTDKSNIRYKKELGGGALLDAGAYPIKISQIILGNNIKVTGASSHFDKDLGVDLWGGGFLVQNNGDCFSEISFGFDNYYQCNLEIWGSKGKIVANRIFTSPPGHEAELLIEKRGKQKIIKIEADNHFINMFLYFHSLISGRNIPNNEYRDNINQSRLISELFKKSS
jgi:dTDP-3,4-didehydro-2,6-dideoxy-alpha-D-glucose 3-reductase